MNLSRLIRRRAKPASWAPAGLPAGIKTLEFERGVEYGLLYARAMDYDHAEAVVHADMAELIMRLAESRGLSFRAGPHEHDERCAECVGRSDCKDGGEWLDVTINSGPA